MCVHLQLHTCNNYIRYKVLFLRPQHEKVTDINLKAWRVWVGRAAVSESTVASDQQSEATSLRHISVQTAH